MRAFTGWVRLCIDQFEHNLLGETGYFTGRYDQVQIGCVFELIIDIAPFAAVFQDIRLT